MSLGRSLRFKHNVTTGSNCILAVPEEKLLQPIGCTSYIIRVPDPQAGVIRLRMPNLFVHLKQLICSGTKAQGFYNHHQGKQ